mmetsp:Transcript_84091/g.252136  ORF Transcript_84091/g.252136 Transcript_84091/m.252136 type:complete len:294 (+) Transcript_84091:30-911(+)
MVYCMLRRLNPHGCRTRCPAQSDERCSDPSATDGCGVTLDIATTCDSSNGTVVSVECTHEETKRDVTKSYQFMASFAILISVVASLVCGATTVYAQIHSVVKARLQVKERDEQNAKFEALMEMAERVMPVEIVPATREWLVGSTPSEQEYFRHLLSLLDQNYEDWVALQHKNMQDFLERSQEQMFDNMRFLANFSGIVVQMLCCLRQSKKPTAAYKAQDAQAGQLQDAPKKKRGGFGFGRKKKEEPVRRKAEPSSIKAADDEDDDLVEAYMRARAAAQAVAEAGGGSGDPPAR